MEIRNKVNLFDREICFSIYRYYGIPKIFLRSYHFARYRIVSHIKFSNLITIYRYSWINDRYVSNVNRRFEKKKKKKRNREISWKNDILIFVDIYLNISGVVSPNLPPARNERTRGEQPWPSG